jgi:hypothetical protein
VVSRAVCPKWVPLWNCLTNVGASDSGMAVWPSVNFHHQSSRKFPPSVSNQTCFCEVCHGSHSDKGHRNKVSASEAKVCPPMRAPRLAFLLAFWFPQPAVVFPFWCPQQCMTATCLGAHTAFSNFRIFLSIFNTFFSWVNDSIQSHYCMSGKACVFSDKVVAIHEKLNVRMTNGLVG